MSTIKQRKEARRLLLDSRAAVEYPDDWELVVVDALSELSLRSLAQAVAVELRSRAQERRREPKPRPVLTCAYCGAEFVAAKSDQRYCRSAHRQAAYRRRVAESVRP